MWHFLTVWLLVGISTLVVACFWHDVHVNLKSLLLYGLAGPVLIIYVLLLVGCFFYTEWYRGDRSAVFGFAHRKG
ncbi:MAG: hypothetical protein ACLQPD_16355 [Desulfomonilaceae bacterium]